MLWLTCSSPIEPSASARPSIWKPQSASTPAPAPLSRRSNTPTKPASSLHPPLHLSNRPHVPHPNFNHSKRPPSYLHFPSGLVPSVPPQIAQEQIESLESFPDSANKPSRQDPSRAPSSCCSFTRCVSDIGAPLEL
jgi:hypothetical protein